MSNLLEQASLVMIPSGYKEDIVYSVIPTSGAGDLTFTRASNGTRIDSNGNVEVVPWNLVEYSEDFTNAYWPKSDTTITANAIAAPNGTTTADKLIATATNANHLINKAGAIPVISGQSYTFSLYAKAAEYTFVRVQFQAVNFPESWANFNLSNGTIGLTTGVSGTIESVGNGWYRCSITQTATGTGNSGLQPFVLDSNRGSSSPSYTGDGTSGIYIWGAQLNIGSTAKPYFPTTDRLNVPRLTYQNGGGGCPSLLLEKQSTNLILSSQDFSNTTYWAAITSSGSVTTTANYAASPDGTQNATRLQLSYNGGGGNYAQIYQALSLTIGQSYTVSVWLKSLSGTPTILLGYYNASENNPVTLTTEWVRHTLSFTAISVDAYPKLALGFGFSSTSADFLAWGYQIEASSYPTSYIPTTSSSATRVADACYKTGISSLIGQTEGVIFIDVLASGQNVAGTTYGFFYLFGDAANNIQLYYISGTLYIYIVASSSVVINTSTSQTITPNTRYKMALAYKSGQYALYVNGAQIYTSTASVIPAMSQFNFNATGFGALAAETPNNYNEFILFPTRLTNSELAQLTGNQNYTINQAYESYGVASESPNCVQP